jgi:sigma-B regulation protein RsbU (phosphoserine phosphatase)
MALGVVEGTSWGHTVIQVPQGALLLLYTDGVVDAHNLQGECFGNERMLDVARGILGTVGANQGDTAQAVQDGLIAQLQQFVGGEPQFDDITLMTVQRKA